MFALVLHYIMYVSFTVYRVVFHSMFALSKRLGTNNYNVHRRFRVKVTERGHGRGKTRK